MYNTSMRRFIAALVVAVGLFAVNAIATAQYSYTCIIVNGVKVIILNTQGTASGSTGSGTFNPVVPVPPTGPINASFTATNINVTASDPVNGTITTRLAPGGTQPLTTIVSNQPDIRFPATGKIVFNGAASISSKPGVIYTSTTPLEFTSTNLTSTPPFQGETFTLSKDVDFIDAAGDVALTLKSGSTSVTLGQNNGN